MIHIQTFAFIASTVSVAGAIHAPTKRFGVCYDPYHDLDNFRRYGPANIFRQDFRRIAKHFGAVRTYASVYNNVEIGPFIAEAGLRATIGIHTEVDETHLQLEIQAAIRAANDGRQYVDMIAVGNENLHQGVDIGKLKWIIQYIQSRVPSRVRVGTVQKPEEWLQLTRRYPGIKDLAYSSDFLGVNIYPFFSKLGHYTKVEMLQAQWNQIRQEYPNLKVMLMETG